MGKRKKPAKTDHWSKRLWYFLWYDDSLLSWVANIVLAFLVIQFLFYPLLGALFGTSLPLVAVISESMEHRAPFDEWWGNTSSCQDGEDDPRVSVCAVAPGFWYERQGINATAFQNYPLANGFNRGDVIVLTRAEHLEQGDVVVFQSQKTHPIIHRIVASNEDDFGTFYVTKGDNNPGPIVSPELNELQIREEQLIGKARFRIPYLGYLKLLFTDVLTLLGVL